MAAIEVHGLTKRFGSVTAVDNLTFELEAGTITGLLGPNGAGKTTTLRMLLGLVAPTEGTATFGGCRYVDLDQPARQVGAVLEASSFHPGRRAVEHLRILASAAGLPASRVHVALTKSAWRSMRDAAWAASRSACVNVSAWPLPSWATRRCSCSTSPPNGLDPEGVHWLRTFLRSLADAGRTVVVSSHLLAEVSQTVDTSSSSTWADWSPTPPLRSSPQAPHQRSSSARPTRPVPARARAPRHRRRRQRSRCEVTARKHNSEAVGEVIASLSLVVHEMRLERSNLEDAFFSLTAKEGIPS